VKVVGFNDDGSVVVELEEGDSVLTPWGPVSEAGSKLAVELKISVGVALGGLLPLGLGRVLGRVRPPPRDTGQAEP
jgi:hypothetical protein